MKLVTHIHHLSGHCRKVVKVRCQRSRS